MLLLRVLETSGYESVRVPEEDSLLQQQTVSCALTIVSRLWNYREAHGLRLEYWLAHASFLAAMALIPTLASWMPQIEGFEKACQLLFDTTEYLPIAKDLLFTIKRRILRENIQAPGGAARIFAYLAARTERTIVRNVGLITPRSNGLYTLVTGDAEFSNVILAVNRLTLEQ